MASAFRPGIERREFLGERGQIAFLRHGAHFIETGLDIGNWRFKAEIGAHQILSANRMGGGAGRADNWRREAAKSSQPVDPCLRTSVAA